MILTPEEISAIRAHAEAEYPRECCGVVLAHGAERRLLRFRNAQDEMHRRDPAKFPRDATRAYYVDGADQRRMYDLMDKGFELSVIYHSHPDTDAYFSPTDRDQAAPPPKREPVWPGTTYVVLSVRKGCADECAAFRWAAAADDFIEVHRARLAVPEKSEP
jgi:proteasome lid subunit RPN8/RPN11